MHPTVPVEGCVGATARPRVTIRTSGARKRGNRRVRFSFAMRLPGSSGQVRDVKLTLPRGGKVAANSKLRRNTTRALGGNNRVSTRALGRSGGRALRIAGLPGVRSVNLKTKNSAVTLNYRLVCGQYNSKSRSRSLRRKRARCLRKRLTFTVQTVGLDGARRTFRYRVRAGSLK